MAWKRKDLVLEDPPSPKRFRRGITNDQESDLKHDPFDNEDPKSEPFAYAAAYKQNGERRAWAEARYDWKYVCDVEGCGQRFNRPCRLEQHMLYHTDDRPFACSYEDCNKTFRRKDHLKRHFEDSHVFTERTFACDWDRCDKSFPTAGKLKRHVEVHKNKFYCTDYPPCNEVFRKPKTLNDHIRLKHTTGDPFPCTHVDEETGDSCTRTFKSESGLKRHVLTAHGEKDKQPLFSCLMCPTPGTEMETIQTGGGLVTIAKEPLQFTAYQEALAHERECHPPICLECGKIFKTKENLRVHTATIHVAPEERPQFPCPHPECGKVFNRESNMQVHVASVHEKKKNFICAASSFTDSKKEDLKNWDGNNACNTPFGTKVALVNHVRTQHLHPKNKKRTARSQKRPEPSMLRLLTGVGYDGGRDIACLVKDCGCRYFMDRDLRRHLREFHQVPEAEVEDLLMERTALQGGPFWLGGQDEPFLDPETPESFETYQGPIVPMDEDYDTKSIDPRLISMNNPFDLHKTTILDEEEAEMDEEMGLNQLQTWNAEYGFPRDR